MLLPETQPVMSNAAKRRLTEVFTLTDVREILACIAT